MKKLRSIHLFLGCVFAPMLLFFAISGIWQTLGFRSGLLALLSTIHMGVHLKSGVTLSSSVLRSFVVLMALGFIVTTVLGVIMAVEHGGNRKLAYKCLAFGVVFPLAVILFPATQQGNGREQTWNQETNITQLALSAGNGDTNAFNQMVSLFKDTAARPASASGRGDKYRAFRLAFNNLGWRAGHGDDDALHALLLAAHSDGLEGFAIQSLGIAAGLGNQKALEPLLRPVESYILPSSAISALRPAADNGNQRAIAALAVQASDPAFRHDVVVGLKKAATEGANATAIQAMAVIVKGHNDSESKLAISALETASSNDVDAATQALDGLKTE